MGLLKNTGSMHIRLLGLCIYDWLKIKKNKTFSKQIMFLIVWRLWSMGTPVLEKYPYSVRFGYGYALGTPGFVPNFFFLKKKIGYDWVRLRYGRVRLGTARVRSLYKTMLFLLLSFSFFFFSPSFFPKQSRNNPPSIFFLRLFLSQKRALTPLNLSSQTPTHFHQPPSLNWSTAGGGLHPSDALPSPHCTRHHHGKARGAPQSPIRSP